MAEVFRKVTKYFSARFEGEKCLLSCGNLVPAYRKNFQYCNLFNKDIENQIRTNRCIEEFIEIDEKNGILDLSNL